MAKQHVLSLRGNILLHAWSKSYSDLFVGFIFCTEKQRRPKYLSIGIYVPFTSSQINMIQAPMADTKSLFLVQSLTIGVGRTGPRAGGRPPPII